MCRSLWQTPAAFTLISTRVPAGCGVGSSISFNGALNSATLKLFMFRSRCLLAGVIGRKPPPPQDRQSCTPTAISRSKRPRSALPKARPSPSTALVCSPSAGARFPAATLAPDIRNGMFMTLKVPPPSSTSASCAAMAELRIAHRLGHRPIGRTGHAVPAQLGETFFGRDRPRPAFHALHQFGPMAAPVGIFRETRVLDPFGMPRGAHQALKGLFAGDRHHHIAIRRLDRAEHRPAWRRHVELRVLDFVRRQA